MTEQEKAVEIIDFLVMSGDIFDRLTPDAREELGSRLESGDYTKVRDAARIAAELRAALDVEGRWRGVALLASFESLLETVRKLAKHPLGAAPSDVEGAARLARAYSAAQVDFDELCGQYDSLVVDLFAISGLQQVGRVVPRKRRCEPPAGLSIPRGMGSARFPTSISDKCSTLLMGCALT